MSIGRTASTRLTRNCIALHNSQFCIPIQSSQIIVMFKFLVYYAIPLVFIATFYIIMAHHLVLSTKDMPGEIHGQTKQIQARKKVRNFITYALLNSAGTC